MLGANKKQLLKKSAVQQYVFRLLFGDMLAQVSRYPLRVPMRMKTGAGKPRAHGDKFIQQGAALLVGLGLSISSFSLKKLAAMPEKSRRLL